jgi:hypothetical protein
MAGRVDTSDSINTSVEVDSAVGQLIPLPGKPANIIEKMLEGKLARFHEDFCLLESAVHQGSLADHRPAHRRQSSEARRKHQRPPLRPLQSRRTRLETVAQAKAAGTEEASA